MCETCPNVARCTSSRRQSSASTGGQVNEFCEHLRSIDVDESNDDVLSKSCECMLNNHDGTILSIFSSFQMSICICSVTLFRIKPFIPVNPAILSFFRLPRSSLLS